MNYSDSIRTVKGIGEKTAALFGRLGIVTIEDLITYYPREYDVFEEPLAISQVKSNVMTTICGTLRGGIAVKRVRNLQIVTGMVQDDTGTILVIWFNMPFLKTTLKSGMNVLLRGRIVQKSGELRMEHPAIYSKEQYQELLHTMQPKYTLTAGLTNNAVTKAIRQVLSALELKKEYLPLCIREENALAEYNFSLQEIHFPKERESFLKARKRLVFDEFLFFILSLRQLKKEKEKALNSFQIKKVSDTERMLRCLPYELTNAQKKVWSQIEEEMTKEAVMNRLVQGDVGSGKTIIAVLALLMVVKNDLQGAMMVPTEVLAKQHFAYFQQVNDDYDLKISSILLTGSMTAKEKRMVYEKIQSGEADIVVGTHALIQEKVEYKNLALVVTDEQHRFGVRQRETFAKKGKQPHVLVMSATPIPRTLAIILYGDLDVSVIDELPAQRLPIKNCVVNTSYRKKAYQFIQSEVKNGRQAYIICPMVEESEAVEAENVMEYTDILRSQLPNTISVSFLHGKMKPKEKNEIMERFAQNEIQVLVSTTVVEVGVNVPNATVMMIENAERFGLAQLHQLRGRVGRGEHQSYCILVQGSDQKKTKERLEILNRSNDGFFIASEDFKLRGPGDLFGIRQSGLMEFKLGDIYNDAVILQQANEEAAQILREAETLSKEQYAELKLQLERYRKGYEKISL